MGILHRFHIVGVGEAPSQLRISWSMRLGMHLAQANTCPLEKKSHHPCYIPPKTTKYSSEELVGSRDGHLETPQSKIWVRKIT